jgi:hypothetical protein
MYAGWQVSPPRRDPAVAEMHIIGQQAKLYLKFRRTNSQQSAAVKAGFSAATSFSARRQPTGIQ